MNKIFLLLCLIFLGASIFTVTINIPGDQPTIQTGINVAANGDIILVQPGTYVENINYYSKNITVASLYFTTLDTSYISQTIIDGNNLDSVVIFENAEDSTSILIGFTITNGHANGSYPTYSGGGIHCGDNTSPVLENLIITSNIADHHGGGST